MKKIKEMISLIIILLALTGCVKMEVNMEIRKDKSMTLGIIQAANESLINQGTADLLDEEEKKEFQDAGYKIEEYKEKEMIGYKITKEIKNIDDVSTENEITTDLGLNELKDNNYIFTIKKGLFKNTYKATLKNSDTEEINDSLNNGLPDDSNPDDILEDDFITDEDITIDNDMTIENDDIYDDSLDITEEEEEDTTNNDLEDFDYSALMSGIEVTMKVKLPYKALSNNATTVENDGTTLTWDLMNFKEEEIKFEFEMYNTKNIVIISAIGLLIIVLIIFLIIKKTKKKKTTTNNNNGETSQNTNPITTQTSIQETQQMLNNNNYNNIISTPQEQVVNNNQQLNNITGTINSVENQNIVQTPTNTPIQEQQPINSVPQNNKPIFEPIQPTQVQTPITDSSNMTFNQIEPLETSNVSIIQNETSQNQVSTNQPINNVDQVLTPTVNNTPNEQPTVIQSQSIFEPPQQTNVAFENNTQQTTPIQPIQNQMPQVPTQSYNQPHPTEQLNQQFNSNQIFTPQEQPQTTSIEQPINLEPMPQPMNLEQIGATQQLQQQVEPNQQQNIQTTPTSRYDSILSNNTDK